MGDDAAPPSSASRRDSVPALANGPVPGVSLPDAAAAPEPLKSGAAADLPIGQDA